MIIKIINRRRKADGIRPPGDTQRRRTAAGAIADDAGRGAAIAIMENTGRMVLTASGDLVG